MLHHVLSLALAWASAHPAELLGYALGLLMALAAQLPKAWAQKPLLGFAMRLIDALSILTHKSAPGTLKWPGVPSLVLEAALEAGAPGAK